MKNSVIEKMKKAAASNSLTINSMDNIKNEREQKKEEIAMNWEIVFKIDNK